MRYAPRVRYAHLVGMTSEVNYKAVLCVAEIFERAKSKILRREANLWALSTPARDVVP